MSAGPAAPWSGSRSATVGAPPARLRSTCPVTSFDRYRKLLQSAVADNPSGIGPSLGQAVKPSLPATAKSYLLYEAQIDTSHMGQFKGDFTAGIYTQQVLAF